LLGIAALGANASGDITRIVDAIQICWHAFSNAA
jgi:hypothetical protein